ncbi:MAG: hypothetical protein WAT47_08590, partial [Nostocoides sp.]
ALDEYATLRDEPELEHDRARERALREITLSFGEHVARAQAAWARESLETLAALAAPGADATEGTPRARGWDRPPHRGPSASRPGRSGHRAG